MTAASCVISTRFYHHIHTVMVREDLVGWVQSGAKTIINSQGHSVCQQGQLFMLARGTQWDVINQPATNANYQALVLQISPELNHEFQQRYRASFNQAPIHHHATLTTTPELQQSLAHVHQLLGSDQHSLALKQHRVIDVLLLLAEQGYLFPTSSASSWVDKVSRLIGSNPQAEWTVDRLAQTFNTSTSTLRRRMSDSGTTLGDLIREIRLETGLMLLQSTELPIGEIASRCGYESHSRFTAAFRQRFGLAPSALRAPDTL